jgi:hypothetical protein
MSFDQYHEPPDELPAETRTFARLCASLTEEAEAIGWYRQRLAVEPDPQARAMMNDAMGEEFKHFSMYEGHDAQSVQLYLEESFSFRVPTPEAAVALTA